MNYLFLKQLKLVSLFALLGVTLEKNQETWLPACDFI